MFDLSEIMTVAAIAIIVILLILLFLTGYVKASPDTAFIISGLRKKPKVLIGKAGIKIPFLEKKDELNLQLIPIDVKTSSAVPTADYINIRVDAAVNIKISDQEDKLKLAAQNFLNKKVEYIAQVAREVLEGNMREIVGKMNLEEMVSDRQKFATLVKENAEPDLAAMGLDIVSFNVQNFVDGNGVIENLGVDNIVKIQKNAAISRAESEKEIAKAQAMAKKEANDAQVSSELQIANAKAKAIKEKAIVQAEADRQAKEAQITADTQIAQKENELAIKKAELQRDADTKKAIADAAYNIQQENERKTVEIATADANLARQEKAILLQEKEVELKERTLEATIKKQAEADKFAEQQKADADLYKRQKEAEAQLFEMQKEAEAQKAAAEALKFKMEQEAAGIIAKGQAEAEAARAKGLAEAEAIDKKAEAMAKYGQAAILEMFVNVLPEIAKNVAAPISAIDKVTVIGGDSNGVADMAGNVPVVMSKVMESVKEATGIDLGEIVKANTYDAKVTRNINVTGLENTVPAVKEEISETVKEEVTATEN